MKEIIGIIYAMDKESEGYSDFLSNAKLEILYGIKFFVKTISLDKKAIFVKCGINKVNAAFVATLLVDHYAVSKILLTGIAGSISKDLTIYDVFVPSSFVQHDIINLGEEFGYIDGLNTVYLQADEMFSADIATISNAKRGLLASGEQFINQEKQKKDILKKFPASLAVDMESGAVAQVCIKTNIPFSCIKIISDSGNGIEYWEFAKTAGQKLVKYVLTYLNSF